MMVTNRSRSSTLAGFGICCATLLVAAASGQEPTAPVPQKQAPTAFGEIPIRVTTPPPAWIAPGLRLTYHTMSADVPHEVIELASSGDADQRYFGHGSHGYLQANVVGLNRQQAAVQMLFFLFDGMNTEEPVQNLELGYTAPAGTGGDLWMHPSALKQLLEEGATGLNVLRTTKKIDLATYDAVLIHSPRPRGKNVWMYDLESGVLLYSSEILETPPALDGSTIRLSGSNVRVTTFKGSRTPNIPWAGEPGPDWLGKISGIDYRGQFIVRQPGLVETPISCDVRLEVTGRGAGWLQTRVLAGGGAHGSVTGLDTRVAGNHQLAGQWVPPSGLARLKAGQELDRDPMTKVSTRVARVDAHVVVIVQQGPRQTLEFTYRKRDGLFVRGVFTEAMPNIPNMSKVVELELAAVR